MKLSFLCHKLCNLKCLFKLQLKKTKSVITNSCMRAERFVRSPGECICSRLACWPDGRRVNNGDYFPASASGERSRRNKCVYRGHLAACSATTSDYNNIHIVNMFFFLQDNLVTNSRVGWAGVRFLRRETILNSLGGKYQTFDDQKFFKRYFPF